MARRKGATAQQETGGQSKLRVVFVEMEGSDQTIADAIKNVTNVIKQGQIEAAQLRQIPAQDDGATDPEMEDGDGAGVATDTSTPEGSSARKPRSPSAPRNLPKPKVVEGVDFRAFSPTLEEYVAERDPESQLEKYLVAVGWFAEVAETEEFGIDHVYSVFKAMKWTDLPPDVRQPLVDLQRKKELLSKGSRGFWKMNHLGEAELERMKRSSDSE